MRSPAVERDYLDLVDKKGPVVATLTGCDGTYHVATMRAAPIQSNFLVQRTPYLTLRGTWIDGDKPSGDVSWRFRDMQHMLTTLAASQRGLRVA